MTADSPDRERFAAAAREERPDLALLCLLSARRPTPRWTERASTAAQIELDRLAGMLPYGLRRPARLGAALEDLLGGHREDAVDLPLRREEIPPPREVHVLEGGHGE